MGRSRISSSCTTAAPGRAPAVTPQRPKHSWRLLPWRQRKRRMQLGARGGARVRRWCEGRLMWHLVPAQQLMHDAITSRLFRARLFPSPSLCKHSSVAPNVANLAPSCAMLFLVVSAARHPVFFPSNFRLIAHEPHPPASMPSPGLLFTRSGPWHAEHAACDPTNTQLLILPLRLPCCSHAAALKPP